MKISPGAPSSQGPAAPSNSRSPTRLRVALATLLSLCFPILPGPSAAPLPAAAQTGERPTIGLVLSGGGARGCAHAGVLQVLEELRIPIDVIAGTSMGAVVGGFYAAGRSPAEIQSGLGRVDWSALFTDQPAYRQLSMRRKADARRYLDLELGWNEDGVGLPSGLLAGQKLGRIFRAETLPALGIGDFDNLPTPFRALATDLATGLPVVLAKGDLSTAMLASMSIPGVFAPVELDGATLVDGGLTANLPVSTARAMGAEVTLAVDVASPPLDDGGPDSVFGVLAQTLSLLGTREAAAQAETADLLLRPDLGKVSPMGYEGCVGLFAGGAESARARAAELGVYSLPEDAWREHLRQRSERKIAPPTTFGPVSIEGVERSDPRRISRRVKAQEGQPFDLGTISADLGRIAGLGEFEQIQALFEAPPEAVGVTYRVGEKSWGPRIFRLGLFIADNLEGNTTTDVLLSYTHSTINRLGAEWRLEIQGGNTRRIFTELYQPLDYRGRWFVAPRIDERRTLTDVYSDDRKVAEYAVATRLAGADLGLTLASAMELRLGAQWGRAEADVEVGASNLPRLRADLAAVVGSLTIDRLDSAGIPHDGYFVQLSAHSSLPDLGADDRYDKFSVDAGWFGSRGPHGLFGQLTAGGSPGSELPAYDEFTLGGIQSLSGFSESQLRGQSFAVARLGYSYRVYELPPALGGAVYLVSWIEGGNVSEENRPRELSDVIFTGTLAVGIETRLGPLYLAYGAAEGGFDRVYAALGKRF